MTDTPLCPNCSTPMSMSRTLESSAAGPETNVYQCRKCNISFVTEDHCSVAGVSTKH
jgi:primosomal protein N'